jgi:hypothetical protein
MARSPGHRLRWPLWLGVVGLAAFVLVYLATHSLVWAGAAVVASTIVLDTVLPHGSVRTD